MDIIIKESKEISDIRVSIAILLIAFCCAMLIPVFALPALFSSMVNDLGECKTVDTVVLLYNIFSYLVILTPLSAPIIAAPEGAFDFFRGRT